MEYVPAAGGATGWLDGGGEEERLDGDRDAEADAAAEWMRNAAKRTQMWWMYKVNVEYCGIVSFLVHDVLFINMIVVATEVN